MNRVSKRFGNVQALENVDLHVETGTIHAVVGENGAGKTTLMRVLYGALKPDDGEVKVEGKTVNLHSTSEAISLGVGMVSQHYGIIPELSCLQNLILGAEGGAVLDLPEAKKRAESLANQMGFQFDWDRDAAELSPAGAQKLEILKLLWRSSRIMILDEPTAMLSPQDGAALFESLQKLASEGATVILVTHRLPEVMNYCKNVTVLRGGKRVAEKSVSETNPRELASLIVGGSLHESAPPKGESGGPVVFEARDLVVIGDRGEEALKAVSFSVGAGEILGIAGVDGSGQRELFHAIMGTRKVKSGQLSLNAASPQPQSRDHASNPDAALDLREMTRWSPDLRIAAGLRVLPEDRHAEAVIEEWSLEENAALGLQRLPPFSRSGRIDSEARRSAATAIAERFHTKHGGLGMPMASLSGGNQQRFVAARALFLTPKLILAFQPARGLDLNSTQAVYAGIREACESGAAAIVVSFDLDELLEHCDRLVAMNRGQMFEPAAGQERDRDAIGCLMVGAS